MDNLEIKIGIQDHIATVRDQPIKEGTRHSPHSLETAGDGRDDGQFLFNKILRKHNRKDTLSRAMAVIQDI